MRAPVVVGVDGSDESRTAAAYGAELAVRRHTSLALVHGYLHPVGYGALGFNPYAIRVPDPLIAADEMLDKIAAAVRADHPGLHVVHRQVALGGASALVNESGRATAVVVGHRGLGGFAELLLGSVSAQVAAHASGPVIVVRAGGTGGPVVVGVDGSPGCTPALEYAFAEAAACALPLVALYVHDEPTAADAADSEAVLAGAIQPWTAVFPDVPVRRQIRPDSDAEQALIQASEGASLIVVGSRGRGGFTGLVLGSVSQALVHHGRCPVAVVHPLPTEGAR
jgi:nucleotide-binding universal stress UspA family protein